MDLSIDLLDALTKGPAEDGWYLIIKHALEITSQPITEDNVASEVSKRDHDVGVIDHFLATSGWDLWNAFGEVVERTSTRLVRFWQEPYTAKAVLILDGLSLRELPWLLAGASERGFSVGEVAAYAAELPGDTNQFARALGFASRSQLQNNGGGPNHQLVPAHTECIDLPWRDCIGLINSTPNWVFWHQWPDTKVHDGAGAGQGLEILARDAAEQLTSQDFWDFVERLATGRRLVITSDHGYAVTGSFHDATGEVGDFLKGTFSSGRNIAGTGDIGPFVPPVALQINGQHGAHLMALGRRKWKSQGGYPTLTHGGLSLLEVLSPYVELVR